MAELLEHGCLPPVRESVLCTDLLVCCVSPILDVVVPRACGDFFLAAEVMLAKIILGKEISLDTNDCNFISASASKSIFAVLAPSILSGLLLTSGICLTLIFLLLLRQTSEPYRLLSLLAACCDLRAMCCVQADRGLAEIDKLLMFLLPAFPSSTSVWWGRPPIQDAP